MRERLEAPDRTPELLALADVREHVVKRALGHAQRLGGDDQPLVVQPRHQLCPRPTLAPHEPVRGHIAVREVHVVDLASAHRLDPSDFHAVHARGHGDHRQAGVLIGRIPRSPAHQQHVIGHVGAGDPRLLAVDHVTAINGIGAA